MADRQELLLINEDLLENPHQLDNITKYITTLRRFVYIIDSHKEFHGNHFTFKIYVYYFIRGYLNPFETPSLFIYEMEQKIADIHTWET